MKVEYVFVADYAIATDDGRFNAIGAGIRSVASPRFPHIFPNITILASLEFTRADVGRRFKLDLSLLAPDGSLVLGGPDDWFIAPTPAEDLPNVICVTLSGQHIQFTGPGNYTV